MYQAGILGFSTRVRRIPMVFALSMGLLSLSLVGCGLFAQQNPSAPTPTSTAQAGPYTIALFITPNPPPVSQLTHLILRVTDTSTGQPVTDAGVQIRGIMEGMEMSMGPLYADFQKDGSYATYARLLMSGPWRIQVTVTRPNSPPASTQFEISAVTSQ